MKTSLVAVKSSSNRIPKISFSLFPDSTEPQTSRNSPSSSATISGATSLARSPELRTCRELEGKPSRSKTRPTIWVSPGAEPSVQTMAKPFSPRDTTRGSASAVAVVSSTELGPVSAMPVESNTRYFTRSESRSVHVATICPLSSSVN